MTKQEFLAMSLPYRICCEILDYKSDHVGTQYDFIVGINQWSKDGRMWSVFTEDGARPSFDRVKPVLHQLSDLTKEIEHKGDKFVPINRLKNFFGWDYLWNCHKKERQLIHMQFLMLVLASLSNGISIYLEELIVAKRLM